MPLSANKTRIWLLIRISPHLVVPEPHPAVCIAEGHHMVHEWLAFVVSGGGGIHLNEQLFQQLEVWLLVKCL